MSGDGKNFGDEVKAKLASSVPTALMGGCKVRPGKNGEFDLSECSDIEVCEIDKEVEYLYGFKIKKD